MKRVLTMMGSLLVISLTWTSLLAQNTESAEPKTKEITIKIKKDVNGVETTVDTTFTLDESADVNAIMKDMGIDRDVNNHSIIVKGKEGDAKQIKVQVNMETDTDGENGTIVIEKEGDKKVMTLKNGDWTTEDGTVINLDELEEKEGVRVLKFDGDKKGNVWHSGDGSVIHLKDSDGAVFINVEKKDGKEGMHIEHKGDGKVIMINRNGKLSEEQKLELKKVLKDGDINIMIDDVDIDITSSKTGDGRQIIKIHAYSFKIEDITKEDIDLLKDAGTDVNAIENGLSTDDLRFFPNPSNGKFRINYQSQLDGVLDLKIRDINGKQIYHKEVEGVSGAFEQEFDISDQAAGVYFLTLTQSGQSLTKKLVIE